MYYCVRVIRVAVVVDLEVCATYDLVAAYLIGLPSPRIRKRYANLTSYHSRVPSARRRPYFDGSRCG